mgnify:CR=1 FL=1
MQLRRFPPVRHYATNRDTGAAGLRLPSLRAWVMTRGPAGLLAGLLAVLLASPATVAFADQTYYRWTDERGNLVMSDRPPERPDIAYETIAAQGNSLRRPARPAPPPADAGRSSGTVSAPQGGDAPGAARQVAAVERDPELCQQARENLEILEMKPRIRIYNEQGELEYLTPEQIEEEKRRTRMTIETHCEG